MDRSNWPAGSPERMSFRELSQERLDHKIENGQHGFFFLNPEGMKGYMIRPAPCVLVGQLRLGLWWRQDQSDAQSPAQRMSAAPGAPGELHWQRITV